MLVEEVVSTCGFYLACLIQPLTAFQEFLRTMHACFITEVPVA